jgi:hypothetical protein
MCDGSLDRRDPQGDHHHEQLREPRSGAESAVLLPHHRQHVRRGTRSLTLDVVRPEGHALLHRLVPRFGAVFNNLRGDLMAKLGLDYASLRDANPRVVCCSLSRSVRQLQIGQDDVDDEPVAQQPVRLGQGPDSVHAEPGAFDELTQRFPLILVVLYQQ